MAICTCPQNTPMHSACTLLLKHQHFAGRCFQDGFPDLFVHDATKIRNRHVGFLASFHDPAVIFEQVS